MRLLALLLLLPLPAAALLVTAQAAQAAQPCTGPACCVVYGVEAVCRSAAIEREAMTIALVKCPACNVSDVAAAVYSLQMNRGPYADAQGLADDVLRNQRQPLERMYLTR